MIVILNLYLLRYNNSIYKMVKQSDNGKWE
jgi:hypothetical protein